jgi:hypothetical protein
MVVEKRGEARDKEVKVRRETVRVDDHSHGHRLTHKRSIS